MVPVIGHVIVVIIETETPVSVIHKHAVSDRYQMVILVNHVSQDQLIVITQQQGLVVGHVIQTITRQEVSVFPILRTVE